jgi:hypothetical protein
MGEGIYSLVGGVSWVVGGKAAMDCRRACPIILDIVDTWTDNLEILYTYSPPSINVTPISVNPL